MGSSYVGADLTDSRGHDPALLQSGTPAQIHARGGEIREAETAAANPDRGDKRSRTERWWASCGSWD